jgi:hypothetical protein
MIKANEAKKKRKEMIHFNIYRFVGVCRLFEQLFWLEKKAKDKRDRPETHQRIFFHN